MTIRQLFWVINTNYPRIEILDYGNNVIYSKKENTVITEIDKDILNSEIAWIYKIDSTMINVQIKWGCEYVCWLLER